MKWREGRRSDEVEDRRGMRAGGRGVVGGGLGLGGLIVLAALGYFITGDPLALIDSASQIAPQDGGAVAGGAPPADDEAAQFVSVILADTEDTWSAIFSADGERYQKPHLVLFSDAVASACGTTSSAVGPFYCPGDATVYIDLSFYRELDDRFGAPGDFAQAYVVAHEVGHHVQNLLGIDDRVRRLRRGASEVEANQLSVRQELQADCFAGVWGHNAGRRDLLEPGDIEEGLNAAAAIGDDRLQRMGQGRVTPETWTHGSSAQRVEWFRRGFTTGRIDACDTFASS